MKILVTGDGGLVFSKSKHEISILRERMCLGLEFSPGMSGSVKKDWWEFDISYEGRRSIMNDITLLSDKLFAFSFSLDVFF